MEHLGPPAFNPHLKRVLETYQSAAVRSLSGPSSYVAGWGDPSKMSPAEMEEFRMKVLSTLSVGAGGAHTPLKKPVTTDLIPVSSGSTPAVVGGGKPVHEFGPPPFPIQQVPLFMPMDSSRSEKSETILEGETISCFIVGGEKRLCLPQILNTVLRDFSLHQINAVCDDLHIFCSRCNPEQLDNLKMTAVLPLSAPSCGLITKTDAERLCNALLHSAPEKSAEPPTPNSFRVYHECFGKCKGIFSPELYTSPHARCIECVDCHGMFCPQKFVCHSHNAQENRTCHWGFDSANWRSYLLISKDQDYKSKFQDVLDRMKARFDYISKYKRKESPSPDAGESKRARYDEDKADNGFEASSSSAAAWAEGAFRPVSAFQPWAPSLLSALKEGKTLQLASQSMADGLATSLPAYLQTGPPVLLNPERVIPHSESSRYERHFAPNVSLAPQSQQMVRVKEEVCEDGEKVSDSLLNNSELNVSSDTEDSSNENPAVQTVHEKHRSFPQSECSTPPDYGPELLMIRRALCGEVANKESARDLFIKEYLQLRQKDDDRYRSLLCEKRRLEEEVEYLQHSRKQLSDLKSENRFLKKEIETMRSEHERRIAKLTETMAGDVTHNHKSPDVVKNKAKYKAQIADLKARLRQSEQSNVQLKQEMDSCKLELQKLGHEAAGGPSPGQKSAPQDTNTAANNSSTEQSPTRKYKHVLNGKNTSPVPSVKEEPKSDGEQSANTTTP